MTDIARLGFSAQTGDLKKAKADLDALVPSATKAEQATSKFNRTAAGITTATKGAGVGIKSFDAAATGAVASTGRLNKTALATGTAMGTVQRAAVGASAGINDLIAVTTRANAGFVQADAHVEAYRASLAKIPAAAQGATSSLQRLGAAANDNINRLQSTPGNIAAQFQDIGVTAAGGMNPLLIALQQGTQLSSAMQGGIGNLLAGFAQLFSLTTILTVGLVGLVAAGLQMIDWAKVGSTVLEFLADNMETVMVASAALGTVMAVAFAPQIITWILTAAAAIGTTLYGAIVKATGAMIAFSVANPFGAIVIAIGAVIAAMYLLDDTFGGVFSNALAWVKKAANFIIGAFVGSFNAIIATWKMLPSAIGDYVIQAANWVLKTVENMVNGTVRLINGLTSMLPFGIGEYMQMGDVSFGEIANPLAGMADATNGAISAEMGKAQGVDYVGGVVDGIKSAASWASGKLRGWSDALGISPEAAAKANSKGGGASALEKAANAYEDLIAATEKRIGALRVEATALSMSENAAHLYRIEQDLIAQALEKNIPLTDTVRAKLADLAAQISRGELDNAFLGMLRNIESQGRAFSDAAAQIGKYGYELEYTRQLQALMNEAVDKGVIDVNNMTEAMRLQVAMLENRAAALAAQAQGNREAEFAADATKAHEERMFALQREAGELRLTGVALQAYRLESDMLADAMRQGIELTPETLAGIKQQSIEFATAGEAVRKYREEVEFHRETFKGFFTDMIGGLRQGQSVWEAFGNAVLNVVNKIMDRLLDMGTDGLLNKLISLGGSLFGAAPRADLVGSVTGAMAENPGIFAKGGAFGSGGQIHAFAKGGAFTNGIYDSPTLFKFAKGGAMGVMGEAGPEAVMPLKRGPDGSLGVQMNGPQTVRVQIGVNDDRFNAYVDQRAGSMDSQNAPAIAEAGSRIATGRMAAQQRRSLS